jgi:universal stress protein E
MPSRQRILVVMDKPKHPQHAFERALMLQARTGAHLDLKAFVYHPMADQTATFDTHQRRQLKATMLHERAEWLRGQVLDAGAAFDDVSIECVWSKDLAGWVAGAAAQRCDLVIKSVQRHRTLLHTPTDWQLLRDCRAPVLLVSGRPWARKIKADVVVMGTTARQGLRALVIGNAAERVLAKVPCDVLALKP